jgi:hypothetical protein
MVVSTLVSMSGPEWYPLVHRYSTLIPGIEDMRIKGNEK